MSQKTHVQHNSGCMEWYTPASVIEAARCVMGGIDLDPASCDEANATVGAARYYTIEDDGLILPWFGRVWLNPPYRAGLIVHFVNKLVYHYLAGDVTTAIVLVNNATETGWFQRLAGVAAAVAFPTARVRFWRPDGRHSSPLQGQAICYIGENADGFRQEFSRFGWTALKN